MMVKNEQELLPQCLESLVGWVDEIIVVDTGSEDRTVEIADAYGAIVYHHPWQNDFSLHRNQSISYATCDWIFIIDADEEVTCDMSDFNKRLDMIPDSVGSLVVSITETGKDRVPTSWLGMRFFRRNSGIQYKNKVHNKAVFNGASAATNVTMNHYGYSLHPEKMAQKLERTESLLVERIKKDPKDHAALYYLCQMRVGQKRYEEAYNYGMAFFACVPVGPEDFQFYSIMYFYMAWSALHMNDGEKAFAWATKGIQFYPDDLDLRYTLARIGWQSKRNDILNKNASAYLELYAKKTRDKFDGVNSFVSPVDPLMWQNRTIYTANIIAKSDVERMMLNAA